MKSQREGGKREKGGGRRGRRRRRRNGVWSGDCSDIQLSGRSSSMSCWLICS